MRDNIVKMPPRSKNGLLDDVSELFENVKKDEVDDCVVIYTLKSDKSVGKMFCVIKDSDYIISRLEKLKMTLIFEDIEDEMYDEEDE